MNIRKFVKPAAILAASACLMAGTPAMRMEAQAAFPEYLKSVTYFGDAWPINFWGTEDDNMEVNFTRIKADGFNSIILVVPWREFQPGDMGNMYNEAAFSKLDKIMKCADDHGLMVTLRIGYCWDYAGDASLPDRYSGIVQDGSNDRKMWLDYCKTIYSRVSDYGNSLLPEDKRVLIVNNGAYSTRAVEVCQYYGLPHINLEFSVYERPDLSVVENVLQENPDIAMVYTTHHETGTGILNPIREMGAIAHKYQAKFVVDTTSSLGMIPFDIEKDNVDFCMASAQKGLQAMTGLSFIIGNEEQIKFSKKYPKRSYYCNLYLQYENFERTGEMHFTPPVQTIYATRQALNEYFEVGEEAKFARHKRVFEAIHSGINEIGLKSVIKREWQSGLVVSVQYPEDPNWDFEKIHDYCYERGFTIYPGKISTEDTFRICALGEIEVDDIENFFKVLKAALNHYNVTLPMS
jgi:2-aminoethylphosphonate-pyruvate transaminase